MRPVLVVSPHLDDAVLSAGQFMSGRENVTVATLFAGQPPPGTSTDYDRKCGFENSSSAVYARRLEDTKALATLKVRALHLDYLDGQYDVENEFLDMVDAITGIITTMRPEFVLAPLGLLHADHVTARYVALAACRDTSTPCILYEELPYRVTNPEAVTAALSVCGATELTFIGDGPIHRKMAALWRYRSQMRLPEFDEIHPLLVRERFWRTP